MRSRAPFLLAIWFFAALSQAAWAQSNAITVTIQPASPTTAQEVYAELGIQECMVASARFGILIGQIPRPNPRTIELVTKACDGGSTAPFRLRLGFLEAGEYNVQMFVDSLPRGNFVVFTVAVAPQPPITMTVETVNPREYVPVAVRMSQGCYSPVGIARPDSHTIILTVEVLGCSEMPSSTIELGRFAAGSYRAILRIKGGDPSDRASVDFTVAKGAAKLDYSDLWEVTGESGWGLTLKQHDLDRVFVVVYSYRADGRPLWLAMTGGEWESPTRFAGAVYRASGPAPANAGVATNKRVGTLLVDFDSPQSGTATLTREATDADLPATKTWRIGRLGF
jgi:hypothetical protein